MDDYSAWVGRSETREDVASLAPLRGLAALLDHDMSLAAPDTVPPLGHWLYFLPDARQSAIGEDGHPRRDGTGLLPPVPLPRRMWAGGRIDFLAPIPVGAALTRLTTIDAIRPKRGASGDLLFVTLRHEIAADGIAAVREEQDLVYRAPAPAGTAVATLPSADPDAGPAEEVRSVSPDPVLLFRYSALTFNAHRIHYDREYAQGAEGYAGLVVQGPLIATLLMDHFLRTTPGAAPRRFTFRAEAPLIEGASFDLCLSREAGEARLWARDAAGRRTMRAGINI